MNGTHKRVRTYAHRNRTLLATLAGIGTLLAVALSAPAHATGSLVSDSNGGPVMSGRAYGVGLSNIRLLGITVPDGATPDTGQIVTSGTTSTSKPCGNIPAGTVTATLLCPLVTTDAESYTAKADQTVATAHVGLPGLPAIDATAIEAHSKSSCYGGSSGSTTIAYLKVGPTVVISKPTDIRPNTTLNLGLVSLVLNEQVANGPTGGNGMTVNAIHVKVNAFGLGTADVVISSAQSGVAHCYVD